MNARFSSLNAWADELFDLFEVASKPVTSFHVSSLPAAAVNAAYTVTTGTSLGWGGSGGGEGAGGYVYNTPTVVTTEWFEPITKYVTNHGTPWDNVNGFPPVKISVHQESKSLQFVWALAGIQKDLVDLEFDEDLMVLSIKKAEKKEDEKDSKWAVLRNTIKTSISGEYKYSIPAKRFDVAKSKAKWESDLLVVEIPVKDESLPVKVKISK